MVITPISVMFEHHVEQLVMPNGRDGAALG
jgi:hypothetical protein